MAVVLPDIIGEYFYTPTRFATGDIQYAGYFEPDTIAPEQITHLFLFLQNTLNAPVGISLKINVPHTGGLFGGGHHILKVQEPVVQIKLAPAEAGLLTVPVTTAEKVQPGQYELTIEPKISVKGKPDRIRPPKAQCKLSQGFIESPVGLDLVATMGATYVEKSVKKASFTLKVAGKPDPPERAPRLKYKYQTIWLQDHMGLFNRAVQEINQREVKLKNELGLEPLYAALYAESTVRLADSGLPLRIGEAIILAKILTYSCQYFLSSSERRNGLLVPIWERALESEVDTTDILHVLCTAGYFHILKLSIAISFGLVAKAVRRQFWSLEERQAVTNHIAECIEVGQELDVDFLYLPLLMGGIVISDKLTLNGENSRQTMALMKKAYEARSELFSEADMAQANQILTRLLK
jgi:hypothetical protein